MFLSLTSTAPSAHDLGVLLDRPSDRVWSVDVGFGTAHLCFPRCDDARCTVSLLIDVDQARPASPSEPGSSGVSSALTVAIGRLFGDALAGECQARPDLVDTVLSLEIELPVMTAGGGDGLVERLFEPLGYRVGYRTVTVDEMMPGWDEARSVSLALSADQTVAAALSHLSVLLPVLDRQRPSWVASGEIDLLLGQGGRWLAAHPERDLIARWHLTHRDAAAPAVLEQFVAGDDGPKRAPSLNDQRLDAVAGALLDTGARRVIDLGCGDGQLIRRLLREPSFEHIVGVDSSARALERARERLRLDQMPADRRDRVSLLSSVLTKRDERLVGFDAAAAVEVIEHIDFDQLSAFEQVVFGFLALSTVIVTTPNREYNVHLDHLQRGLRHSDHQFEWTRQEFAHWSDQVAQRHGYRVVRSGIGRDRPETGPPTQMAVFHR